MGVEFDFGGFKLCYDLMEWCWWVGVVLLWIVVVLMVIMGYDYFCKVLLYFREFV